MQRTTSVAPKATLLETVWRWFVEHVLRPLLHPLAKALDASHGVGTVLGFVIILVATLALGALLVRLVVAFARPAGEPGVPVAPARALATARSSAAWASAAREAAARGDFARAIAALFAAALVALDERALVVYDAARTPGEYRRLVRRVRIAASAPFDELTDRFVYAAYGSGAAGASDFEAAARAFAAFEPAVLR
jgi:hypothetical protein